MNILHVSTHDIKGGAARAAYRLHTGLNKYGLKSRMLVEYKSSNDEKVTEYKQNKNLFIILLRKLRNLYIHLTLQRYNKYRPKNLEPFSLPISRFHDSFTHYLRNIEIINLHWVAGFFDYKLFFNDLSLDKHIVWTLHDMYPITGGCHYAGTCDEFKNKCGNCPQLGSSNEQDLSRDNWVIKSRALISCKGSVDIVTPSNWLANKVKESSLLSMYPITVIPNGIDTSVFRPVNTKKLRNKLGIDNNSIVIGFVSESLSNKRKGLHHLKQALDYVNRKNIVLVSIGLNNEKITNHFYHIQIGSISSDQKLAEIYSLFDVYVCSSLEDNLPNTIIESFSCGTPVLAYRLGGIPDIIISGENGILVDDVSPEALGKSLNIMIDDKVSLKIMAAKCRSKAKEVYSLRKQAENYNNLYMNIVGRTQA